ncbi:uncharacterized protein LOC117180704 [Belonocnema kinseyi]|uniref:uncharacterized protein LOC117180704 n=1 Tax=Belonocnema kinseyi TaxID=2817044 RepID=UPI00143D6D1E|nr:uncharacterized protein LOC117180704 [Belonocnema kinseyi]
MMKFLVLALIAISVVSGTRLPAVKGKAQDTKITLQTLFNMSNRDFRDNCEIGIRTRLRNAEKAHMDLSNAYRIIKMEAQRRFNTSSKEYYVYLKEKCLSSQVITEAKIRMIKAALPCASEEKVAKHLKYSESHVC